MDIQRLRRSLLYTPGSDRRKMEKALTLESDGVIFDLEDAVSPEKKPAARAAVAAFLRECGRNGKKELLVRVNQVATEGGIQDILAVAPSLPDTLVIPKAHGSRLDAYDDKDRELLGRLLLAANATAKALGLTDFRVVINCGPGAQQTVFHLHLHLLGGRDFSWPPG